MTPSIDESTIEQFERDGAICVRGLFVDWVERLRAAIERTMAAPGERVIEYTAQGNPGRFHHDLLMWQRDADFRAFVFDSPAAALAGRLMRARKVNFFYDQLFVKEPGTLDRTPWHQDQPYWPVRGTQIVGVWLALDAVTMDSGAVEYVRGSHRWGKWYVPKHFGGQAGYAGAVGEVIPDIDAMRGAHEFLAWDMAPGDCIVFHALAVHGSGGNRSNDRRRRGLSTRWLGEDVRYDGRPGTYPFPDVGLRDGDVLDGAQYPVVWRA
jgi:ectoine hydroxylase-related dioxygenase (phytanoyl-CoA dioxygenase family)